jgi:hypothetical protein
VLGNSAQQANNEGLVSDAGSAMTGASDHLLLQWHDGVTGRAGAASGQCWRMVMSAVFARREEQCKDRKHLVNKKPLWCLTGVDRTLEAWHQVVSFGASDHHLTT